MSDSRLLSTFLELVQIDSPTGSEAECAAYCAARLEALGFNVRFDDSAAKTGSNVGNLIAERVGASPKVLAFSAHLDCVEPCRGVQPVVEDGVIASAGETVLGADDKAGIAATLEACERLVADDGPPVSLKVLFTVQEEAGLVGAKHMADGDAACDLCLVLDAEGPPGGIVVGAPTHYTFVAEFVGRASHAGVAPEKGVSAINMAADAISRMRLGRLDENTTANIGPVHGGTATNVVAARCEVRGECRSHDTGVVEALRDEMDRAMRDAAEAAGGTVDVKWTREYEGFGSTEEDPHVKIVMRACDEAGLVPLTYRTGGGSDANVLAAKGVPVLALACGMQGVHGTDEHVALADIEAATAVCVEVARLMAEEG
jgi:tripeptide aminopeptidase